MPKRYWLAILTYILMHVSALIFSRPLYELTNLSDYEVVVYWGLFSFTAALIIILILMKPDMQMRAEPEAAETPQIIIWSVLGLFMAFIAQAVSGLIETEILGIEVGSENTKQIIEITSQLPIFLIIPAIIAPILEEIVFRKVIFGSLYKRMNFFLAALISSFIFGIIHGEPQHILIYGSMGFVFAFLYIQTKRIIVPIIVHATMNSIVVIIQVFIGPEEIERLQRQLEEMMIFIGG